VPRLKFWSPKEEFLILEILPHGVSGLLLTLDGEKRLRPERFWENFSLENLTRQFRLRWRKRIVIAAADPSLAVTLYVPARLEREPAAAKEPLGIVELENLVAQSVGKVFNQCRKEASRMLMVDELDTVLVGTKVHDFKVDGHRVLDPVGFQGKRVDAVLELTLTTRVVFDAWRHLFHGSRDFLFTDLARSALTVLAKLNAPSVNLVTLGNGHASFFILEPAATGTVIYRRPLKWRTGHVLEAIAASIGAGARATEELYRKYLLGEMSDRARNRFFGVMRPVLGKLFEEIGKTRLRGKTYLDSHMPLPISFPKRHGKVTIDPLLPFKLAEELGFRVKENEWAMPQSRVFRYLAPFLEFYYDKSNSLINQKLWRRLHWLAPSSKEL